MKIHTNLLPALLLLTMKPPVTIQILAALTFIASSALGDSATSNSTAPGQLAAPIETISLRQEAGREVCILGQRSRDGKLVLTPDTCFFHGKLRLTGPTEPKFPGAELNGNKSYTRIEGLEDAGSRVVWPLWLPKPATLKLAVQMEVPAGDEGATLEIGVGDSEQTVITHASDGNTPQPWTIELPVTKPGLHELSVTLRKPRKSDAVGALTKIEVTGPGVNETVLVRSRWRAAAIHAGFRSSELETNDAQSRLWVMEARPLPCEDSMYAPITTPFGYFGSTFNPDGTSGGINFSMWSYAAGKAEPPMEQLSHLLALGDSRQEFGGFGHEGTGVKPRGWNPFEGQKLKSIVLALRLDPGDPYDTYTGYFFDRPTQQWKLYASGRKWHTASRGRESLLPGSFVEVPGPPDKERSAQIQRGVDFRGWCRDEKGAWHPIDQMNAGDIRKGEPVQKVYELSSDGWFRMAMGGLEQYRYDESKPIVQSAATNALPDYMTLAQLAVLDTMPASVTIQEVNREKGDLRLRLHITTSGEQGKLTLFYGPKDASTFSERWAKQIDLGELRPGDHTVKVPEVVGAGVCRALLSGKFGSVWTESASVYSSAN